MTQQTTPQSRVSTLTVLGIAAAVGLVPLNSTMIAVALPRIADDFEIRPAGRGPGHRRSDRDAGRSATRRADHRCDRQSTHGQRRPRRADRVLRPAAAAGTFALWSQRASARRRARRRSDRECNRPLRAITPAEQQGRAFGSLGSAPGTGAASGPVIGGVLTQAFGGRRSSWSTSLVAVIAGRSRRISNRRSRTTPPPARRIAGPPAGSPTYFVAAFSVPQALDVRAVTTLLPSLTPIILDARGWESCSVSLAS